MKKIYLLSAFIGLSTLSFAQGTSGLIAHWDMNGTTNDVSAGGHNGHGSNLTPATGMDGIAGHGYYFNGINSMITVPYSAAFNVAAFTFCATVKVEGFNTGTCQMNLLMARGATDAPTGNYDFFFNDKANTTNDCAHIDSTEETFHGASGGMAPVTEASYSYTPAIVKNQWYSFVFTFNDTAYKTYINGVLKNTAVVTSPGSPIGISMDSISIGYNVFEAAGGYPYPFKGIMDDIRFYNRVLTTAEIDSYTTSTLGVGLITVEKNEVNIFPNPAQNQLTIETSLPVQGEIGVVVTDLLGREVLQQTLTNNKLNIQNLNRGMYFANIYIGDQMISRKFLKE